MSKNVSLLSDIIWPVVETAAEEVNITMGESAVDVVQFLYKVSWDSELNMLVAGREKLSVVKVSGSE
jgi:hypothetical protein